MRYGIAVLAIVGLVATTGAAAAHQRGGFDGNDTAGPLDIRYTAFDHDRVDFYLGSQMRSDWRFRDLRGANAILWHVDMEGGPRFEFTVSATRTPFKGYMRCVHKYQGSFVGSTDGVKNGRWAVCPLIKAREKKVVRFYAKTIHNGRVDRTRVFRHRFGS